MPALNTFGNGNPKSLRGICCGGGVNADSVEEVTAGETTRDPLVDHLGFKMHHGAGSAGG